MMLPHELAALRAEVLGHVDRFERDLAFTAPELTGMRITLLRESIEDSFAASTDNDGDDVQDSGA
jgi:hypothetical protein